MSLNKQQQAVVDSRSRRILCLAGAGTGKTYTMLARIKKLVADGVDPRSILVLTFTNAAAFEMENRYSGSHMRPSSTPKFGTFHRFCYGLIAQDKFIRTLLGYSDIPAVATEAETKHIRNEAAMHLGYKLNEAMKDDKKRKALYAAADRIMKQRNLVTFDKMCYDICSLFVHNNGAIKRYKEMYKYIFVDEFQDTDPKQFEFIKSFEHADITAVGDSLQNLYSFRGTDSSIIKALSVDPEWEVHKLSENYRSTFEICEFANRMSTYADNSYRVTIRSDRHGDDVVVINNCTHDEQLRDIVNRIEPNTAILCRSNAEVAEVCEYFNHLKIAHITSRSPDRIINLCRSITDSSYLVEWAASLLPAGYYEAYVRQDSISPYTEDEFFTQFSRCWAVREIKQTIRKLRDAMNKEEQDMAFDFSEILKCEVPKPNRGESSQDWITRLIQSLGGDDPDATCYVGTIHSVKGLEFDNVIILDVGGKSFRLKDEDNLNVYYVAITRAKHHLTVYKGGQNV